MQKLIRNRIFSPLLLVLLILSCDIETGAYTSIRPALYDINKLNELKEKGPDDIFVASFLVDAIKLLGAKPLSVVGKTKSFSKNPHDYCSIAPYSWPDDNNPNGAYITKDGKTNPERNLYDRPKLDQLANRLQILSIAYYITQDMAYYDAFVKQIKTWFLDNETYMEPNFDYAQVVKGLNDNKGQTYGLCELELFTPIIESILLVNNVKMLDRSIIKNLESWFSHFLSWILQSSQWDSVSKSNNNIIAGCYVAMVEMVRFTGNKKLVKRMGKEYTERILNVQIDEEGKQPAELRRTIGFGYSVANLKNIVDFALIMENAGVKYYRKNQTRIDAAFVYLLQFVGNHEAFPYKQEASWDYYEDRLKVNAARLQRMSSRRSGAKNNPIVQGSSRISNVLDYVY